MTGPVTTKNPVNVFFTSNDRVVKTPKEKEIARQEAINKCETIARFGMTVGGIGGAFLGGVIGAAIGAAAGGFGAIPGFLIGALIGSVGLGFTLGLIGLSSIPSEITKAKALSDHGLSDVTQRVPQAPPSDGKIT